MSTTHAGAPGATAVLQMLVHNVCKFVTVKVKCTWKPGAPQSPEEKVIVCEVLEPMMAHPGGLPSTLMLHTKLYSAGLSVVPMV